MRESCPSPIDFRMLSEQANYVFSIYKPRHSDYTIYKAQGRKQTKREERR